MIPRDLALERHITSLAAQAAGYVKRDSLGRVFGDTGGIDDFADARALPGGVRPDLNPDLEAAEELADCRSYLTWGIVADWDAYLNGDADACSRVDRRLRALSKVIAANHELHTEAH